MRSLKKNILANFVGQGWAALMQLAFIPLYIKFLGIEAYGLIGFYATLQGGLQILDFGISQTMNRELARYSVLSEKAKEARDFVRTLEVGYWTIGILIGLAVFFSAPYISSHWIKADKISIGTIQKALIIMGAVATLQWPISFYQGGLMGLQRQVLLNVIKIIMATLSGGGAVIILWRISPTITAFFTWQIFVSTIQVILFTVFLWRSLPTSDSFPRFSPNLIQKVWRFAAGLSGITFSALILTQLDKIILSKLLTLEMFGYYTLAGVASNGLLIIISPIFNAMFPRFSALVTLNDNSTIKKLYHLGSQLMAVLILPMAAILSFFSFYILLLWTGSVVVAQNASPILSLLVIGTAINGLMNLPFSLQLAYGWTSLSLRITSLLIIILVPAIFFMTRRYGPIGAAIVWVVLNSIYLLIGVPLTHRRLLIGEMGQWFSKDIGLPLGATLLVTGIGWLLIENLSATSPLMIFTYLLIVFFITVVVAIFTAPRIKDWVLTKLFKGRLYAREI